MRRGVCSGADPARRNLSFSILQIFVEFSHKCA
jgi:hypothetical protein